MIRTLNSIDNIGMLNDTTSTPFAKNQRKSVERIESVSGRENLYLNFVTYNKSSSHFAKLILGLIEIFVPAESFLV